MKKKRKKWPWIVLAVVAAVIILFFVLISSAANNLSKTIYTEFDAERKDITTSITASGTLFAEESIEVNLPDGIEIDDVIVSKGNKVNAGDKLASVDIASAKSTAAKLEATLKGLQAQLAAADDSEEKSITSAVSGRVLAVYAKEGDSTADVIKENGCLALISTGGKLAVQIETDTSLSLKDKLTVKWNDKEAEAEVYSRTENGYVITFSDEKAPFAENISVYDKDTKLGEGKTFAFESIGIFARGGEIEKTEIEKGDKISLGTKLFTIKNGGRSEGYYTLKSQIETTEDQLKTAIEAAEYGYITAPEAGIVSQINLTEGAVSSSAQIPSAASSAGSGYMMMGRGSQSLSSGESISASTSSSSSAFVIETGGVNKMIVTVGELDISSVEVGQQAEVTIDAFANEKITAEVTSVSKYADNSGSVANFAVELTLEDDPRLLSGMNGSAVIISDIAENAISIPVEAINEDEEGSFVYVSVTGDIDGKDNVKTYIKTGLSDGEFAQIISGISEGDKIMYVRKGETMMEQLMSMREQMMSGGNSNG